MRFADLIAPALEPLVTGAQLAAESLLAKDLERCREVSGERQKEDLQKTQLPYSSLLCLRSFQMPGFSKPLTGASVFAQFPVRLRSPSEQLLLDQRPEWKAEEDFVLGAFARDGDGRSFGEFPRFGLNSATDAETWERVRGDLVPFLKRVLERALRWMGWTSQKRPSLKIPVLAIAAYEPQPTLLSLRVKVPAGCAVSLQFPLKLRLQRAGALAPSPQRGISAKGALALLPVRNALCSRRRPREETRFLSRSAANLREGICRREARESSFGLAKRLCWRASLKSSFARRTLTTPPGPRPLALRGTFRSLQGRSRRRREFPYQETHSACELLQRSQVKSLDRAFQALRFMQRTRRGEAAVDFHQGVVCQRASPRLR